MKLIIEVALGAFLVVTLYVNNSPKFSEEERRACTFIYLLVSLGYIIIS